MPLSQHLGYPLQASIVAWANSMIQLVSSFGVNLSANQDVAITVLVNSTWVLLMAVISYERNGSLLPPKT